MLAIASSPAAAVELRHDSLRSTFRGVSNLASASPRSTVATGALVGSADGSIIGHHTEVPAQASAPSTSRSRSGAPAPARELRATEESDQAASHSVSKRNGSTGTPTSVDPQTATGQGGAGGTGAISATDVPQVGADADASTWDQQSPAIEVCLGGSASCIAALHPCNPTAPPARALREALFRITASALCLIAPQSNTELLVTNVHSVGTDDHSSASVLVHQHPATGQLGSAPAMPPNVEEGGVQNQQAQPSEAHSRGDAPNDSNAPITTDAHQLEGREPPPMVPSPGTQRWDGHNEDPRPSKVHSHEIEDPSTGPTSSATTTAAAFSVPPPSSAVLDTSTQGGPAATRPAAPSPPPSVTATRTPTEEGSAESKPPIGDRPAAPSPDGHRGQQHLKQRFARGTTALRAEHAAGAQMGAKQKYALYGYYGEGGGMPTDSVPAPGGAPMGMSAAGGVPVPGATPMGECISAACFYKDTAADPAALAQQVRQDPGACHRFRAVEMAGLMTLGEQWKPACGEVATSSETKVCSHCCKDDGTYAVHESMRFREELLAQSTLGLTKETQQNLLGLAMYCADCCRKSSGSCTCNTCTGQRKCGPTATGFMRFISTRECEENDITCCTTECLSESQDKASTDCLTCQLDLCLKGFEGEMPTNDPLDKGCEFCKRHGDTLIPHGGNMAVQ